MSLRGRLVSSAAGAVLTGQLLAGVAGAQTLHGRLTSSFYAWQREPTDSTDTNHLRFYQLGIFHLERLADPRLSLHTYMRVHGDLADDLSEPSNWRLLNLYAQWRDAPRGYDLRGGRMRVYAGVGNVTVDGAYGRYRYPEWGSIEAYVGVQPPLAGDFDVTSWDDRAYGGRLSFDHWSELKVSLSYALRNRAPLTYDEPGAYTGKLVELPNEQEELYGADAAWVPRPGTRLYGRVELDATQRRLKWANTVLGLAPPTSPWSGDFEYMHRAPSIYGNSLLWVFEQSDYEEVSARGGYRLSPATRVNANLAATFLDGDESYRFGAGLEHGPWFGNWSQRSGYGGDLTALLGGYARPVRGWVDLRAQAGVSIYEITDTQDDHNTSFVLILGGEVRPRPDLAIDLEVENLSQDIASQPEFAGYSYDLRGHLRVTYSFFARRASAPASVAPPNGPSTGDEPSPSGS
jgi:hypothetical protein